MTKRFNLVLVVVVAAGMFSVSQVRALPEGEPTPASAEIITVLVDQEVEDDRRHTLGHCGVSCG